MNSSCNHISRLLTAIMAMCLWLSASADRQSVGLVLSGGGAKGVAHIGVIQALEDNDIPIDYIAGTSMGAIVGGLYAAGYTPAQMMELIESRGFAYWSTGQIDRDYTYYFAEHEPSPALASISIGGRDSSEVRSILPGSLISPLPMNFAFLDLFAAYTAQCGGDFDRLFVPFRCVTSDVYHKHKIVLRSGRLGDAIRASMSFPIVFHPIELDSILVYDGGIYDNFPVDVMRDDFAPSVMIGVNVSGPDKKPESNDLFQQLEDMIIQNNDYSLPADEGIKIDVKVSQFGLLDFGKAREIYRYGYLKAMSMIDSIKARVTARRPASEVQQRRASFKAATPVVIFDSVRVTGASPEQNRYIAYLFENHHHGQPDTFGIAHARLAYYRAITPGRLRNLVPRADCDSSTGMFSLNLKATVKDNIRLGAGGYVSSSTASMLFASIGYNTLSFNSLDASLNLWAGQSYMAAALDSRLNLHTSVPSRLRLQAVASRHRFYESERLFFEEGQPQFVTSDQLWGRLSWEQAAGQRGIWGVGVGAGHLVDRFWCAGSDPAASPSRNRTVQTLGQLMAMFDYNTLDNTSFPTAGAWCCLTGMGVAGHLDGHCRKWLQAEARGGYYLGLGKHLSLGFEGNLLWSGRSLLGGYDASVTEAPAFNPTPSSYNRFNSAFRANQYAAAGIVPVWRISQMVQLRGSFYGFMPMRSIRRSPSGTAVYGRWLHNPVGFSELAAVVTLPFANLSVYGNYAGGPGRNWSAGITFGLFVLAPRFLR